MQDLEEIFSEMDREFFRFRCEHPEVANAMQYMRWDERIRWVFAGLAQANIRARERETLTTAGSEEITQPAITEWERAQTTVDQQEATFDGEDDPAGPWHSW